MSHYVVSRTKKDEKTDNWVIQGGPFRIKKEAESIAEESLYDFEKILEDGGIVRVLSTADLKLLNIKAPKAEEPEIPNPTWLYAHTDQSRTRPVLGNVQVMDLKGRGRYAVAANGYVIGAYPTDLKEGRYPGKDGMVQKNTPYPDIEVIIPTNGQIKSTFRVSTHWLHRSLRRAKVFAGQRLHSNKFIKGVGRVRLTVKQDSKKSRYVMSGSNATLSVFGMAANIGESLDLLPCFLEGNPLEVAYNVDYLLNALKGWKGHTQKPTHEFTQIHVPIGGHDPILIEPYPAPIATEDERLPFVVIMPMHAGV